MATKALVTISLDRLVQLRAEARGFSFLLRQPVHSLLRTRLVERLDDSTEQLRKDEAKYPRPSSSYSSSSSLMENDFEDDGR